uniref:transthyretin isoform X2 n=1 Tax=Myxine glutinosa TaxID=7769 RepID=UPI00358EB5ED
MYVRTCLLLVCAVFVSCTGVKHEHDHHQVSMGADCPLMVKALDAVRGIPAVGLAVTVYRKTDDTWTKVASGVTEKTGEIHNLMTDADFPAGFYKVKFDTKPYWQKAGISAFAEYLEVVFEAHGGGHTHYTLPVLMSPFFQASGAVAISQDEH